MGRPPLGERARQLIAIRVDADVLDPIARAGSTCARSAPHPKCPVHQIPALVAKLASEQATLCALQGALTTRLLTSTAAEAASHQSDDRLLTVDEVASTLGVNRRWVQRRARRLPFARRISEHAIRYSEAGLKRWMANRQIRVA